MQRDVFTLRPATDDDKPIVLDLVCQSDMEIVGSSNFDMSEVEYVFGMPRFNPMHDLQLAFDAATGRPIAFGFVFAHRSVPVRPWGWAWTHPDFRGRGVGTALLTWMIDRAKHVVNLVPPEARIVLEIGTSDTLTDSMRLLEEHGFTAERSAYTMRIDFDSAPDVPDLPVGLRYITYAEQPDKILFARARQAGFADHRGALDEPLEVVVERIERDAAGEDFDPNLWFLAMDGDEPAGLAFNTMKDDEYPDAGYVDSLAVLPAYRKQGLGLILLKKSFAELYARGRRAVVLGVDGSSLTGAVRLYERAGMHIHRRTPVYELELRAGIELTKQA